MKRVFKVLLIISVILGLLIAIGHIAWDFIDRTNGQLVSSGEQREYLLCVPTSYDPTNSKAVPLVIDIHGFVQWSANQAEVSQWNQLAEEEGFIVVFPSGLDVPKRWRFTTSIDDQAAIETELQYFRDLIEKLSGEYAIDLSRVYVSGLSNGGGMAVRLACDLPDLFAAIGSVGGTYLVDLEACSGGVPGIFFHGQADKIVPYEGGLSRFFSILFPNVPAFVEEYALLNGCDANETVFLDKEPVMGVRYEGCDLGADVVFYSIADGGHTWPGGSPLPEVLTGKTTQEISATRLMWEFFSNHGGKR